MVGQEWLLRLCAVISLVCGLGMFWQRTAVLAAGVLFVYLLLWFVVFKLRFIVLEPLVPVSYEAVAMTAAIVTGAWVLYASLAANQDKQWLKLSTGDGGLRIAQLIYGLCMIVFGSAHFFYPEFTIPIVPAWLPWHEWWAYFTGCTFILAGIAILIKVYSRLAATLSAVQIGLFTLLVWVPMVAAGTASPAQVGEFVVSCVVTASA